MTIKHPSLYLLLIGLIALGNLVITAQEDETTIRFLNDIVDEQIDVILNRVVISHDLQLDTSTDEITVIAGQHNLTIRGEDNQTILSNTLTLEPNKHYELKFHRENVSEDILLTLSEIILVVSNEETSNIMTDLEDIEQMRLEDGGFVLGNPDAPVTIVVFEDFLCPHCQLYKSTVDQFIEAYVATGLARFEYRFLPSVDPTYSELSAKFAECADTVKPGSFWEAHDLMFELASTARFNNSTPKTFADRMNIPYTKLLECTADANQVEVDSRLATQLGVTGTPTVLVRIGDSTPQATQMGQQPTFEQLGVIVAAASGG